jgi:hypothetical protein
MAAAAKIANALRNMGPLLDSWQMVSREALPSTRQSMPGYGTAAPAQRALVALGYTMRETRPKPLTLILE